MLRSERLPWHSWLAFWVDDGGDIAFEPRARWYDPHLPQRQSAIQRRVPYRGDGEPEFSYDLYAARVDEGLATVRPNLNLEGYNVTRHHQPWDGKPARPRKPLRTVICGRCGTPFESRHSNARWCSKRCRANFNVRIYQARISAAREPKRASCVECGKEFVKTTRSVCCSMECSCMQSLDYKDAQAIAQKASYPWFPPSDLVAALRAKIRTKRLRHDRNVEDSWFGQQRKWYGSFEQPRKRYLAVMKRWAMMQRKYK